MTTIAEEQARRARSLTWAKELLIDGERVVGAGEAIEVLNPATAETVASVSAASIDQLDRAIASARAAFDHGPWPKMSRTDRAAAIHRVANRLAELHDDLVAGLITEVGTPHMVAISLQTKLSVDVLRVYADLAAKDPTEHLGPHFDPVGSVSMVARRPIGVAAIITAYNFPILLAVRSLGAALAAGCTSVILPSPRAPLSTLLIADIFSELPPGTVNIVLGGPEIGIHLTSHPDVDKIAFTGSPVVGAEIMRQAADRAKSISLELGDKSPVLVLPGVDMSDKILDLNIGYLFNTGQSCGATTRLIVPKNNYDHIVELSRDVLAKVNVGDPWDSNTLVGPLIRREHRDGVLRKVDRALSEGAEIVASGPPTEDLPGFYMSPLLLGGVNVNSWIAQNELFGPVGVIIPYGDVEEAIAIANGTPFGLNAKIFANDVHSGIGVAERLRFGSVQINGGGFRPDAPFGGMKSSGVGREYGDWGINEFSEFQHVQWAI